MKSKKTSQNVRPALRRTLVGIGLVAVLLLALIGASFAAPVRPNGVIDVKLFELALAPAAPNAPLGKSTIGNYVWHDYNANGDYVGDTSPNETEFNAGIAGVALERWIWNGTTYVLDTTDPSSPNTTVTDATGKYLFGATSGGTKYWVKVADSNFAPGGALVGYVLTSAGTYAAQFSMPPSLDPYSHLTADFGYAKTSLQVTKSPPAPGQTLLLGSTATFQVAVKNTGEVALANITIADLYTHLGSTVSCTPSSIPGPLAAGATAATVTCTVTNVQENFSNTVRVTGTPVDGNGNPLPGTTPTADSNPAPVVLASPGYTIEKQVSVDGGVTWQDADTATGPYLLTGTNPQFRVIATNTGNAPLTLNITDPTLPALNASNVALAVGAANVVVAGPITGTWAQGQQLNTASVTATYTDGGGQTFTQTQTDPANYFGAAPGYTIEKQVSVDGGATWQDADTATGPYLLTGTNPQFRVIATNTGNVPLTLNITDPTLPALNASNVALAVGAANVVVAGPITGTWAQGQQLNTASVTATYTDGGGHTFNPPAQTDPANYFGAAPGYTIEKQVSVDGGATWQDADTATGPYLLTGTNPRFRVIATNTGNVPLTLNITDPTLPALNASNVALAVGAANVVVAGPITGAWAQGQQLNTASVTATYTDGGGHTFNPPAQTDPANYFGAAPGYTIEKQVSVDGGATWQDADTATGPYLLTGTNPQFRVIATNTGNVPLTLNITDPTLPTLNASNVALAVGAANVVVAGPITGTWAQGQQLNTASVTATYTDGGGHTFNPPAQTDPANYFGAAPGYTIEKQVSVDGGATWQDADTATGPYLPAGTNPQFRVIATNTGNVPLTLNITDPTLPTLNASNVALAVGAANVVVAGPITGTWAQGQQLNTASVTATYTDGGGHTFNPPAQTDPAYYYGTAGSLGDLVWWDVNGNGVQDPLEPGIPGVHLTLSGYPPDVTDVNGLYSFDNLLGGTYVPTIPAAEFDPAGPLSGFERTTPFQTLYGGTSAKDSNGVPGGGNVVQAIVNLPQSTSDTTIDFGFVKPTSYELLKTAVTVGPVVPGAPIQFKITIHNTGSTWIMTLPLVDTYETTYLTYVSATPVGPDSTVPTGTLTWADVTGAGSLAPGASIDVLVNFTAGADTTGLNATPSNNPYKDQTINKATVPQQGTVVDADGPDVNNIPTAPSPVPTLTDDAGIEIINPTGVALAGATATVGPDGVLIAWNTADESDILGFNVLAGADAGSLAADNAEFILAVAAGTNLGAAYSYLDAVAPGAYTYALEVIKLDGSVERIALGPVVIGN